MVANLAEIQPTQLVRARFYEKLLTVVASPDPKVTAAKLRAIFGPRIRFLGSGGIASAGDRANSPRAGLPVCPDTGSPKARRSSRSIAPRITVKGPLAPPCPASR